MSWILLIEDDEVSAKYIERVLGQEGHAVVISLNPAEATELLNSGRFDLIISDINFPNGISGFDFVRNAHKKLPEVPIAFITGRNEVQDIRKALECGADDYMVKPTDPEVIVSKVQTLLEKKGHAERHFAKREISVEAKIELNVYVTGLSESSVTLITTFPLEVRSKLSMGCPLLDSIGLHTPMLRVVSCEELSSPPHSYLVEGAFIGLSETHLQAIRRWMICHPRAG